MSLRASVRNAFKGSARKLMLLTGRHWARPALVGRGTVQDLFYWTRDEGLDTVVVLNNFYSAFFPALDTATRGSVLVYDSKGRLVGEKRVVIGHLQGVRLTVSELLAECGLNEEIRPLFGTLVSVLDIPKSVTRALATVAGPFYFWHRSVIGYTTAHGQIAFVHDVDTALTWKQGSPKPTRWYGRVKVRDWAPEMPVDMTAYERLDVVLLNRAKRDAHVVVSVRDSDDREKLFEGAMAPNGVCRFELMARDLEGLAKHDLRLRVRGIPTEYGRPLLFKRFRNGTIAVGHS